MTSGLWEFRIIFETRATFFEERFTSFLSFVGLGVSAPIPSLGSMANDALNGISSYPLNMIYPAVMISLIILCFNVLGDSLRDALDPRMRK